MSGWGDDVDPATSEDGDGVAGSDFREVGIGDDEDWDGAVNLVPVVMRTAAGHIPTLTVHGDGYRTVNRTVVRSAPSVIDVTQKLTRPGPSKVLPTWRA